MADFYITTSNPTDGISGGLPITVCDQCGALVVADKMTLHKKDHYQAQFGMLIA